MKKQILALAVLLFACAEASAQVKTRWRLQWTNEKPQIFVYRSPNDVYSRYWFFTYTLHNPETSGQIVPLITDVMLYTETGKELQNDPRKVDDAVIKAEKTEPRKAEALKYGRFYASVIDPEAEYKIIEYHARLGARSPGIVRETIDNLKDGFQGEPPPEFSGRWKKGDRLYLNPREIRRQRFISPGQTIMGIAIFKDVDPRARLYDVHVTGLVDIVKISVVTETEWKWEYEPQVLKISYQRFGDAFNTERDVIYQLTGKRYVVKKVGPIAAKDTVDRLVTSLLETYKKEKKWRDDNVAPDEVSKQREADGIDMLDTNIMAMVFKRATGMDMGWDRTKDVVENETAVFRIHEWWITNRTKLVFDEIENRFIVKDDPLPGTVKVRRPDDPKE